MTRLLLVALLAGRAAGPALAQHPIRGVVVGSIGETPIPGARVLARRRGASATTDGLGRFGLDLGPLPDTLLVTAIGWRPDTVPVAAGPAGVLQIRLERTPTVVSDLIVTGAAPSLDLSAQTRWAMAAEAARSVPPAVETDVFRALALIPGVSFTSPFSARPMLRGYDAQELASRIDGFEVLNLYHLGRVFSSFPAEAAEQVTVAAAPGSAEDGGSAVGAIDVTGRSGWADRWHGGGGLSFGSIGGYAGGGGPGVRVFGAARTLHLKALDLLPNVSFPYHFEDFYGTAVVGPVERPRGRVTIFASQDRVDPNDHEGLDWYNLLAGSRWRIVDGSRTTVEVAGSGARFAEHGREVPTRHGSAADFENAFSRLVASLHVTTFGERTRFATGLTLGWRQVENHVAPTDRDGLLAAVPTSRTDLGRGEGAVWAEATRRFGAWSWEVGLRADLAASLVALQPRLHLQWSLGRRTVLSAAAGRAARLHHLLSDARSEPDLDFFEIWLTPDDTIPAARVDHAVLDLRTEIPPFLLRVSAYASRGSGIGELRPESDQRFHRFEFVRFGRSRTRGLEAQLAVRGGAERQHSFSVSYTYARSERDWGEGWVRWAQDRRHQLRVFGQSRLGRLRVFGALDAATGMPLTPVVAEAVAALPGGAADGPIPLPTASPVYGLENSVGTSGTFRIDGGATLGFGGRRHERFLVGISVDQPALRRRGADQRSGRGDRRARPGRPVHAVPPPAGPAAGTDPHASRHVLASLGCGRRLDPSVPLAA